MFISCHESFQDIHEHSGNIPFTFSTLNAITNGTARYDRPLTGKMLPVEIYSSLHCFHCKTAKEFSTLGIAKERILFVSSNGWDVTGSKAFGFSVGWINRQGKTHEELAVQPDYVVHNLLKLAELISGK